jgi:membrane associated rhomboid family serine protease
MEMKDDRLLDLPRSKPEGIIFRQSIRFALSFVFLMWFSMALQWAFEWELGRLGILPRTLRGLIGILTSPMIHGDMYHLISNTVPLLVLGIALYYFYNRIAVEVFVWIYLVTGLWVWLFARDAYHIGASGLVYGMASFLFFSGIIRRNGRLLTVTLIVLFLYGSMVYGLFPNPMEPRVSWESHALGALCGLSLAIYFRKTRVIDDYLEVEEEAGKSPGEDTSRDRGDRDHYFSFPDATKNGHYRYQYRHSEDPSPEKDGDAK